MIRQGSVATGIQETTQDELEIRAGSNSVATAFSAGFKTDYFVSNPSDVTTVAEIPANYNAVAAGPLTVSGTLTVNGTLTIV